MNFGGNNSNQVNTNTGFVLWYSTQAMLQIGAWNDKLSLKFTPSAGQDEQGLTIWNKEGKQQTALTIDNCVALFERCKVKILPHIEAGDDEEVSVGVAVGDTNAKGVVLIERKSVDGKMKMFLTFIKNIGADGTANSGSSVVSYDFKQTECLDDYDYTKGTYTDVIEEGNFKGFLKLIENPSEWLPLAAHGIKHNDALKAKYSGGGSSGGFMNNSGNDNFGGGNFGEELPFS